MEGLGKLCGLFGKTRQGWYYSKKNETKRQKEEDLIVNQVKDIRKELKNSGVRKLQVYLQDFLDTNSLKAGRDKLFDILGRNGLLVKKRKKRALTTNSKHNFRKYPNIIHDLDIKAPNQLWVSDITYIRVFTQNRFSYLSLVTDVYSKKIVGWSLQESMHATGTLKALNMALKGRTDYKYTLVHHSDRGIQYCSSQYIDKLHKNQVSISMTQQYDPYENAVAERVNRTLKDELELEKGFKNHQEAQKAVKKAIETYNNIRIHASCDFLTPNQAHKKTGVLKKRWKKRKLLTSAETETGNAGEQPARDRQTC